MIRFGSSVMALLMICVTSGETGRASAQISGWLQSEQTDKIEKSELEQTYVVDTRALNFRSGASVGDTTIGALAKGAFLKKLDETVNGAERRTWYRVVRQDGQEGWAASEYLLPVSDVLWMIDGALKFADRLGSATVTSAQLPAFDEIRAGFLYSELIGDAGWIYVHEKGRQAMTALPYLTTASFAESVPGNSDLVLEAIDKLVAEGHNVIFTTSFDHMDPTVEVARRYPDVVFMNCSGYKTECNVGTYFSRMYQARLLEHVIGAKRVAFRFERPRPNLAAVGFQERL